MGFGWYEIVYCLWFCECTQFSGFRIFLLLPSIGLDLWEDINFLCLFWDMPYFFLEHDRFVGYGSLEWNRWTFRAWKTSVPALLDYKVSLENLGIILIGFSSYIIWLFSLAAFNSLSLFCIITILITMG